MSDKMKNEINTNNFKTLIEALEALPKGIRDNRAHIAGLISIVANEIPELIMSSWLNTSPAPLPKALIELNMYQPSSFPQISGFSLAHSVKLTSQKYK
jgi:hypothetical protein